ncbi:zinc finger protein 37 homolog isoform X2 [Sardina pilchardus]|uniref:zinc finger protein 37 homolog isoform X2 n=1 Tax=Sardina pilchardus TaxID=27697 RepID=UPI002E0E10F8
MEEHCNISKKSVVWKHFKSILGENAVICLYCNRKVKLYASRSTTPLNVHLRNRHPSVLPLIRYRIGNESRKRSIVWRHFKLISEGNAVLCLHCKTKFKFSASRTTTPLHVHLRNRHPSVLPLAQSSVHRSVSRKTSIVSPLVRSRIYGNESRKRSIVWRHFKFIPEEKAALCLYCKKKLRISASKTSPLHAHLRNRHPFVLSGELHHSQVVSESEEKVLESERASIDPADSNQLLKLQVQKLQKSLEEKDKEVTETYKSFQQIIQALQENVKSMKEQLTQQTGKHQGARQGRLFDFSVPPVAASSRHNQPRSSVHDEACEDRPLLTLSCTSEPSSPGLDDTEGSAQRSSKDQEVIIAGQQTPTDAVISDDILVEKRHCRQDNKEDEDRNHNKDEVSDYYPEMDPDHRPEDEDDPDDPGDFGESNYEGEDNEDERDIGGSDDNSDMRKGLDCNLEDDGNSNDNPDNQVWLSSSKDSNNISPTDDLENKTGEVYSCTLCNEMFRKVYYVKLHRLIHDKGATLNQCLSEPMKYVRVVQPHTCEVCGEECSTSEGLHIHQRLHDEEHGHCEASDASGQKLYKCGKRDESFDHSTDSCPRQEAHLDERPCEVCSGCQKTFAHPADLGTHQKRHCEKRRTEADPPRKPRPCLCDTCGKAYENLSHLKRHAMVHTGERPHKCSVCDKRFRFHFTLKQHSLKHSENSPFMCHVCGKGFTRLQHVQKHTRVHTKEKPYRCSFCAKDFGYQESLYVHHRRFHSV